MATLIVALLVLAAGVALVRVGRGKANASKWFWYVVGGFLILLGACFPIQYFANNAYQSANPANISVVNQPVVPTQIPTPDYPATIAVLQSTIVPTAYLVPTQTRSVSVSAESEASQPSWAKDFVKAQERDLAVCVFDIGMYEGPGFEYTEIGRTTEGWTWRVYGYVGDWWFIGVDEQKRYTFLPKYALCESQPTSRPNLSAPTATRLPLQTVASNAAADNPYPTPALATRIFLGLERGTPIARQELQVCAGFAPIRTGPSMDAREIGRVYKDNLFPVDGVIGEWIHGGGIGTAYTDGFINRNDLCHPNIDLTVQCNDYVYNRWKNGKSDQYAPPCTQP